MEPLSVGPRGKGTPVVDVYQEEDFRFFLDLERKRAERRGRSLLLVLVDMAGVASATAREEMGSGVLDVLATSVRESDFVGWFRYPSVAAAVLAQAKAAPTLENCQEIGRRVSARLAERVPHDLVEVKVLQLEPKSTDRHA